MPGESRRGGNFVGWTPEEAYKFIRDSLREEGSHFLEERPPTRVEATQRRGRFIRRFEIALEPVSDGILLRGRVTSPEDWPAHVRRALVRLATGLAISVLGIAMIGVSLVSHLDDWPIVVSILLFSAGVLVAVVGWGLYTNARMLSEGREIPFWLG